MIRSDHSPSWHLPWRFVCCSGRFATDNFTFSTNETLDGSFAMKRTGRLASIGLHDSSLNIA